MNPPTPPWTDEMQALWDKTMFIERTRGAYGVGFPQPGTNYRPPAAGSMFHTLLFVATASPEEVEEHYAAVRADMETWKERVKNSRGRVISTSVTRGLDLGKLEIKL